MTQPATTSAGSLPVSRRVMNLAHFLTQAARRFPDHPALVWGERHWSWRALEARVDRARRGAGGARALGKGDRMLVHARNCNEIIETHVRRLPARRRLGADQFPAGAGGGGLAGAGPPAPRAFLCQSVFPDHAAAVAAALPGIFLASLGEAAFRHRRRRRR